MAFKFLILYTIVCLAMLISCTEKEALSVSSSLDSLSAKYIKVPKDSTRLIATLGEVQYHNKPFTGSTELHNSAGLLIESVDYLEGKRNGYFKKWFNNGEPSFESVYVNGKQDGKATSWWRNGKLRSEAQFKNGTAHGLQRQWYKSGALFKEIRLNQGQEEGLQKSWRENGKIYNNYEAKNGRIFGLKRSKLCFSLDNEKIDINEK